MLLILVTAGITAQPSNPDSLFNVITRLPDDTVKIRRLFDLADIFYNLDLYKEGLCLKKGYTLSRRLNTPEWQPRYESHLGANFANTGQPDSALFYFNLAEAGFQKLGDDKQLAGVYSKKRWVYNYLGKFETALEYALKALGIHQKLNNEPGIAIAYSYAGEIFYSQQKYREAADYAQKGYEIQKRLGLKDDLAYSCQSLGDAWLQLGDYEKALAFQNEGLALRRELGLVLDAGLSLNSRGNVLKYMKRYPEALADYRESLKIARQVDFQALVQTCISNTGHIYNLLGQYREALPYHLENQRLIRKTGEINKLPESYLLIAEAYGGVGRFDSAYYYQKLHSVIKDSLLTEETSTRMSELQTKYETAQREARIAMQEEKLREQRTVIWAVLAVLAISVLAGGLLWRLSKQLRKRNEEKEFLIREIHHRVKNNLQVLSSLLYLQSRHIKDVAALDAVREGQNRVEAMGLIHQKLYMGDNLAAVEMRDYLHNLGDTLLDSFGMGDRVKIIYHLEPLHLDVDTAIPLGLIINELVTNSLKYAFPGSSQGAIEIALRKNESGKLCLSVADDGIGKNGAPEQKNGTSFGTSLVEILSKKLKGIPQTMNGDGYATVIEFDHFKEANS